MSSLNQDRQTYINRMVNFYEHIKVDDQLSLSLAQNVSNQIRNANARNANVSYNHRNQSNNIDHPSKLDNQG